MNPITINSITVDCPDPRTLAAFYVRFLGWSIRLETDDFVSVATPASPVTIGFQRNEDYEPPVWPGGKGEPQQMVHIDFKAKDQAEMAAYVAHAIACGATLAEPQYAQEWTVMIDPAGHPFCIDTL